MSELKHQLMLNKEHSWVFAYPKSDVYKVIIKLEMQSCSNLDAISRLNNKIDVTERRELHHKYKRCLAMAKICENKLGTVVKPGWWDKWRKRWLELAEKFKPNNEVNNV